MEQTRMDEITTEMAEYICDKLCVHSCGSSISEEELEAKCAECKMDKFVIDALNTYNEINNFEQSQVRKLMEQYSDLVRCADCKYAKKNAEGRMWCNHLEGLTSYLEEKDGCSKGVKK